MIKPLGLRLAVFLVRRVCCTSEVLPLSVNPIAIPKPDYREVADSNGLGRDRFKSDIRIKTVREKNSEIAALGTER